MNKKEATSLLVSGLAIMSGVVSAYLTGGLTLISPEILAEGLKSLGGLGGNLVANAIQTKLIDKNPHEDVLKNGDLTRAIGSAIFKLCGDLAKVTNDKSDKKALEKLSQTSLEVWENLIIGGEYEEGYGLSLSTINLDEVSAEKSVQYVHAQADKLDEIKALTPQAWQNIIVALTKKESCSLSSPAKAELAGKLHKEFASALRKVLIADFAKDGKAYASMQFRIFGEILTYTQQNFLYARETYELADSLLPIIIDLNKKIDEINQSAPKNYASENKDEWKQVFDKFNLKLKDIGEILIILKDSFELNKERFELEKKQFNISNEQFELLKQIFEHLKSPLPAKPLTQKFIPKNFPESLTYFTGRNKVLENIVESLETHGTAALADTHGVGKSSVMIEFAHRRKAAYRHILFIRATNNEFNGFVSEIIRELGFDLPADAPPEQRLTVLQEWLAKNEDWLLLVDNVDDVEFIDACEFNKPSGKVIYTSNDERIFKIGARVDLPKMLDENAMLLLYKHWQDKPDAEFEHIPEKVHATLKNIAHRFGNHPFSMAFVGSYLAEEDENLEEFLKAYQSKEKNLLEKYKFITNYQHKNVATAFSLRFEQISTPKDDSERERFLSITVKDYLKLSAFVGTDNIPEELLQQSLARLHPDRVEWTEDSDFIKGIYKKFKPTSIFKRDAETKTLTTHRIVQEIMRFQIRDEEDVFLEALAGVLSSNFVEFDFTNKEPFERYLSHVGTFLEYLEENKTESQKNLRLEITSTAWLCNSYAIFFYHYGQYEKAEKYYTFSKNIYEGISDIDQDLLATSYNNLAILYRAQYRYEEAEPLYLKSLKIREEIYGENHLATALIYDNLTNFYRAQQRYSEIEPLLKKALKIRENILGEGHPTTAVSYNNLAGFYFETENLQLAKEYQQKSLKVRLANFGENHPDVAQSYVWLATFFEAEENYQEALDYYYKALDIYLNFFTREHPDVRKLQFWINNCKRLAGN